MSLLTDFEAEAEQVFSALEAEAKVIGAMFFGAFKNAFGAVEAEVAVVIPDLTAKLKAYASIVVAEIEKDPQMLDAVGHWKFGLAAARVWALLKAEFPVAAKAGASTLTGVIETAIQAAFAALVVGL